MKPRYLLPFAGALLFGTILLIANYHQTPVPPGMKVDRVILEKGNRRLSVLAKGEVIRTYRVSLGRAPTGAKEREGDNRTPEGRYILDSRNPRSGYHLSLHVSYPRPEDIARAKAAGYQPGGAIMIHGLRNGLGWLGRVHRVFDWTRGCIALTNPEIEELWRIVPNGTPIEIVP